MTPNIKKATENFFKNQGKEGLRKSSDEFKFIRKINRIKKLANRIKANRARPEEIEEFEARKKALGVTSVTFDKYNRKWMIE